MSKTVNIVSVYVIGYNNGIKMASFLSNYKSYPYIAFNPIDIHISI